MVILGRVMAFVLVVVGSVMGVATMAVVEAADIASVTCAPVTSTEAPADSDLESYNPMVPVRIVDTRDGTGGVGKTLDAGCTLIVNMSDVGPQDVTAFALSVTVISPVKGFFTAFPCSGGQPGTSSVNARPGIPTPNLVVAEPDASGNVCLFSNRGGEVIIDVSGWWAAGLNRFTPIDPVRAYDTRELAEPVKLPPGAVRDVLIGGLFVPQDAVSVTVNIAAVNPTSRGFLVVYPCGQFAPLASNLNFIAGEKRAVAAVVELGSSNAESAGRICVSGSAETHFILDVTGYDAPSSETSPDLVLQPLADTRVVDTREPALAGRRFEARTPQTFDLSSSIPRPDEAVAVVLNVIAVRADRGAYATVYPCQSAIPTTSSLNYDLNQTSNLVVTAITDDSKICVFTNSDVDIVIDLVGVFAGPEGSLLHQLSFRDEEGMLKPLDQDFDVDAADSTMRCDGASTLSVRLGLAPGATAFVNGVEVPPRDPVDPDIDVALPEDGLLSIAVTRGTESAEYYARCLPLDFPDLQVERSGEPTPGWYVTEFGWNNPETGFFLGILNERGVPIWFKRLDRRLIDPKLLSTGDLVASPLTGFGFGIDPTVGHRIISLDGTLVGERLTDSDDAPSDHHDYVELPAAIGVNARAVISYPLTPALMDLTALTLPTARGGVADCANGTVENPAESGQSPTVVGPGQKVVDGSIRELIGDGTLLWNWNASDHFAVEEVTYAQCFGNYVDPPPSGDPGEVDLYHFNSLQRVDEAECEPECDYIVSARHLDAVFRVDRSTDAIDWILGSLPADPSEPGYVANQSGAPRLTIVDDPLGGPMRPHDARLVGDVLTIHDNRSASGQPTRFVAYQIDTSNADPALWTATLIRQIDHPDGLTSGQLGSARVANDGSVLMNWGATQPMFVEYGADDVELLRMTLGFGEVAYRIVKYAPGDLDVDELRATAGGAAGVAL
ncbi:MAG: hypothetical protein ACJAR2_001728 [Ilumatobacter sp.]|jgi:hypothetical protein